MRAPGKHAAGGSTQRRSALAFHAGLGQRPGGAGSNARRGANNQRYFAPQILRAAREAGRTVGARRPAGPAAQHLGLPWMPGTAEWVAGW